MGRHLRRRAAQCCFPENDRRLVSFDVARERVRVLHVAGRPTNDVRALRQRTVSLDGVSALLLGTGALRYRGRSRDVNIVGAEDSFLHVRQIQLALGRFFRAEEDSARRHLVVLGWRAASACVRRWSYSDCETTRWSSSDLMRANSACARSAPALAFCRKTISC